MRTMFRPIGLLAAVWSLLVGMPAPVQAQVLPPMTGGAAPNAFIPYSGTATLTVEQPDWTLPPPAMRHVDPQTSLWHFALGDPTHFRIDSTILSPPLNPFSSIVVANGQQLITYEPDLHNATIAPLTGKFAPYFWRTLFPPGAIAPDPTESIQQYLQLMRKSLQPDVHRFARLVGQSYMLGRPVYVVDTGPVETSGETTGPCGGKGNNPCHETIRTAGTGRLWIDEQTKAVLRYEELGLKDIYGMPQVFRYQVTRFLPGVPPSPDALQFHPPVTPRPTSLFGGIGVSSGSGTGGFSVPPPFLQIPALPATSGLTVFEGMRQAQFQGRLIEVDALYSTGAHHPLNSSQLGPNFGQYYIVGPYLFVQEELRPQGLPASLQIGASRQAGACQVWTGTYPDGQHWLAFQHGQVSVWMLSNQLSPAQLATYAAKQLCNG